MATDAGAGGAAAEGASAEKVKSSSAIGSAQKYIMSKMTLNKEKAKAMLLDMGAPMRETLLDSIKDVVKSSIVEDPDMWASVKSLIGQMVDAIWVNLQVEVERTLESSLLKQQENDHVPGPSGSGLLGVWWRIRAFLLHHYLPHNRSIFGKSQDPVYTTMFLLTMLPVPGLRVLIFALVLVMLSFPGPPDEHQLMNYVVLFKTTQFLSSGFALMGIGSFLYFMCYTVRKDDVAGCTDELLHSNPLWLELADFLGNVLLPWCALIKLQWSQRVANRRLARSRRAVAYITGPIKENEPVVAKATGGSLSGMFKYDMVCFTITLCMLSGLSFVSSGLNIDSSEFLANLLWCEIFYSVCMLPFVVIKVPLLFSVITHCDPTGFNKHGACVPWAIPQLQKKKKGMYDRWKNWKKNVKNITREKRSAGEKPAEEVEGQRGDFTLGLVSAVLEGALDEGAEEAPMGITAEPHLLLTSWDRF